jgi:hypothetical protein
METDMTKDYRDEWITRIAPGKSFVDVGGLWGLVNEKISPAYAAGATHLCMVDIWEPESEWWQKFRQHCTAKGIGPVSEVVSSIDNPGICARVGKHDIVHCSGVIYHCPNPFLTVRSLMSLATDIILLATAVMPPVIENEFGRIKFSSESAVCVPLITEENRKIVDIYMTDNYGGGAYGVNAPVSSWYFDDGAPNYGPWWWLWSADYVAKMLTTCGLEIIESTPQFGGTGHLYLCRLRQSSMHNYGVF